MNTNVRMRGLTPSRIDHDIVINCLFSFEGLVRKLDSALNVTVSGPVDPYSTGWFLTSFFIGCMIFGF